MAGISRATLARRMRAAAFRSEVAAERAARQERILGVLSAVALEAVATLRELLNSVNETVQATAVRTALEGC